MLARAPRPAHSALSMRHFAVVSRRYAALGGLAVLTLAACGNTSVGTGSGSGGAADGGAAATTTVKGLGCGVERETGAVLCAGVSVCPGLLVDQAIYPGCGFRPNGVTFDIQCACQDMLCPIGTPNTCTQARALLDNQNRVIVCGQVNEGRCITGTKAPKPSASSGTNTRGCDAQCMADCARAGVGSCELLCGC